MPGTDPRPVVALLDSGVDVTHEAFGGTGGDAGVRTAVRRLNDVRSRLVRGEGVDPLDVDRLLARVGDPPHGDAVLSGRSFAPFDDSAAASGGRASDRSWLDLSGHGTAAAGVCVELGYRVLPVRVSYTAVNGVDMRGLVEACLWIADRGPGLVPDHVLWPFGVTDEESADLFTQLADVLREAGALVWASGRGAFRNIGPDSTGQWPSDLPGVVAVDEAAEVTELDLRLDDGPPKRAWLWSDGPGPRVGAEYRRRQALAFDSVAGLDAFLASRPAPAGTGLLLAGMAGPGEGPREPVPPGVPIFLCAGSLTGWSVLRVEAVRHRVVRPRVRSQPPAVLGVTGRVAPVACTVDGYAPVFGSSFALPCALPDRSRRG